MKKAGGSVEQEKLGRREQKKIKARNEILDTAVVLFSEKGFMDTSIADIMNTAGMGLGTFYNYFSSKEDVLLSLLNRFTGTLSDELRTIMANNTSSKVILAEMVLFTARLVGKNRYLLPLLFTGAMSVAAISFRAEFFAPSTVTSPPRGCPPSTLMTSNLPPSHKKWPPRTQSIA